MAEVFSTLGGRWAPAVYTLLAMSWHPAALPGAGWLVIAGIAVVAVIGMHPSVRMARAVPRDGGHRARRHRRGRGRRTVPVPGLSPRAAARRERVKHDPLSRLLSMELATTPLPDLDRAEVVVPAPGSGPGNWAGAASATWWTTTST